MRGYFVDALMQAAESYQRLLGNELLLTFSNGESVRLIPKAGHFKHLAGLHKLTDLDFIYHEQRASALFTKALRGDISQADLNCSRYFNAEAKERLESLSRISEVLAIGSLAVYGFDRKICKASVRFKSSILFFKDDGHQFFITFGIAQDQAGAYYYPETIFYRFDSAYIAGQNIVSITNVEIKPNKK